MAHFYSLKFFCVYFNLLSSVEDSHLHQGSPGNGSVLGGRGTGVHLAPRISAMDAGPRFLVQAPLPLTWDKYKA
jgi:hypothetical protein